MTHSEKRCHRAAPAGAGFTMIELLVAMLILAIVLTGLAALQLGTIRNVTDGQRYSGATRLAEGVLSRYQTVPLLPGPSSPPEWIIVTGRNGNFMRNVAVDGESPGSYTVQRLVEDDPNNKRRLLTIRVSWLQTGAATGDAGAATYRTSSLVMSIQRPL